MLRKILFSYSNGSLQSWSQRRCKRCSKFLSKRQQLYCSKHAYEVNKELVLVQSSFVDYSYRTIRGCIGFQLPRFLRTELRGYT
jgi:hypothetical protein